MPDEELWNTMIDMDKDATTEIKMPPMVKKSDTERAASDYMETTLATVYQICCRLRSVNHFRFRHLFLI